MRSPVPKYQWRMLYNICLLSEDYIGLKSRQRIFEPFASTLWTERPVIDYED
jgi:hypothetical protein